MNAQWPYRAAGMSPTSQASGHAPQPKGTTTIAETTTSSMTDLLEAYNKSPYLSIKYDTYFPVYEELLRQYRGKEITIVEVGVFNGGSLFMWRKYLGTKARIIGIDLNPKAKAWENHGFEIYIGDQANQYFWQEFFSKVGSIDILIDDGGHTNLQQITTVHCAVPHIREGGILIVEDVHTSYFKEFGNPWKFSFANFAGKVVEAINSRAFALKTRQDVYTQNVHRLSFFESIVVFHISSKLCKKSEPTSNNGISQKASDFRYQGAIRSGLSRIKNEAGSSSQGRAKHLSINLIAKMADICLWALSRLELSRHSKYWSKSNKWEN